MVGQLHVPWDNMIQVLKYGQFRSGIVISSIGTKSIAISGWGGRSSGNIISTQSRLMVIKTWNISIHTSYSDSHPSRVHPNPEGNEWSPPKRPSALINGVTVHWSIYALWAAYSKNSYLSTEYFRKRRNSLGLWAGGSCFPGIIHGTGTAKSATQGGDCKP